MDWIIKPSGRVSGKVAVPPDKSITHRAIMLAALSEGRSVISNYLPAEDCVSTINAFRNLGVKINIKGGDLEVYGRGMKGLKKPGSEIDAGNSGTTVRLLSGILAGHDFSVRITGDESLSKRPMKRIIEPLRKMNVKMSAKDDNFLPMEITGNPALKAIDYSSPVASAQVKSCVLFAGMQARGETRFTEPERSRDHTERMLSARGAEVIVKGNTVSVKGPVKINPVDCCIPGDISAAAFFLIAAALVPGSKLQVVDVGLNPTRSGILDVLKNMEADYSVSQDKPVSGEPVGNITVSHSGLKGIKIGSKLMPKLIDEIPIITLAATQAQGVTEISGASELRLKESDRIKAIIAELSKMGAEIEERDDGLVVHGPVKLRGAEVESHGDHRIAMTLAVAGLIADGSTLVRNIECAGISFPGFMARLESITAVS